MNSSGARARRGRATQPASRGALSLSARISNASSGKEPGIVQVADGKWAEMESERNQKKGYFSCF